MQSVRGVSGRGALYRHMQGLRVLSVHLLDRQIDLRQQHGRLADELRVMLLVHSFRVRRLSALLQIGNI